MSAREHTAGDRWSAVDVVAGFLAAASIFLSALGLADRPARFVPAAVLLALIAARMTTRNSRIAGIAVAVAVVCWTLGMTIAIATESPLY